MFAPFGFFQNFTISAVNPNTGSLYNFTLFTFTSVGINGSTGPTLAQLISAYTGSAGWAASSSYFTSSQQGYQIWTVPQTANYQFEIGGSRSSIATYGSSGSYGRGAIIKATFSLTQGQKLAMVVGQFSVPPTAASSYNGLGGGGGTYVTISGSLTPMLVAGGGGGGGAYSGDSGGAYKSGSNGITSTTGSNSIRGARGGTGSFGGVSHYNTASVISSNIYDAGGGGGWLGNGYIGSTGTVGTNTTATAQAGGAGLSFLSGSTGGGAATTYVLATATPGGFGGGGGGTPICGGGGGGYSGGAGSWGPSQPTSDGGGGGGSFISSSAINISTSNGQYENLSTFEGNAITNLGAYNTGSGYITITKL